MSYPPELGPPPDLPVWISIAALVLVGLLAWLLRHALPIAPPARERYEEVDHDVIDLAARRGGER